ncbi:MAG TPA: caspase family protein [Bacteroidales bacterium]|nr:caspase family protein [Bacteroidales bacterium]
MKKIFLLFVITGYLGVLSAQVIKGRSESIPINIEPQYEFTKPPILYVDMKFADANGNGIVEADEKAVLTIVISNKGAGRAQGLKVKTISNNNDPNFKIDSEFSINEIRPGESDTVLVEMYAGMNVLTREHHIDITITEYFGYDMDPAALILNTLEYQRPEIVFSGLDIYDRGEGTVAIDYDGQLQAGEMVRVKIVIQNVGNNIAKNTVYQIESRDNNIYIDEGQGTIGDMKIGEIKEIWMTISPNKRVDYKGSLPIYITVKEDIGKGSLIGYQLPLALNQRPPATETLEVKADFEKIQQQVAVFEYKSDRYTSNIAARSVDAIPLTKSKRPDAVAIVIGVEKYENMPPAPYAAKDAQVMTKYFKDVLGIDKVITYINKEVSGFIFMNIFDPNLGQLQKIINKGQTEVYVYYSGHGIPDKDGKDVYLFPYDGKIEMLDVMGYSLNKLYKNLDMLGAKSVTVILDACFSGSSRASNMYIAENVSQTKGTRIVPREVRPWESNSNFSVFTSSKDEQTSVGFDESGTGLFTYFLVIGLQGEADLNDDKVIYASELRKYVSEKVSETSRKIRGEQTPQFYGNDDFIIVEF